MESIETNILSVQARIARACSIAGRNPDDVQLLAVSKTVEPEHLRAAVKAGLRYLGENKVQELREKASLLSDLDIRWAAIGHLQSNKAKHVALHAAEFHALDRISIAETLDRRLQAIGCSLDVFVQVNSSGESSKFGLESDDVMGFVQQLSPFSALRVRGLMTLARFSADERVVRQCFVRMRELREKLCQDGPAGMSFTELSMGMSGDFEIAIEEGATIVRVGQALFGPRSLPDSHYWPT